MIRPRLATALALLSGLFCFPAGAHVPSESFSRWHLHGQQLSMTFTVATREASRIPRTAAEGDLAQVLIRYLATRVHVLSDDDSCARHGEPAALAGQPGYLRVEARWRCLRPPTALEIRAFADLAADHSHYVTYSTAGELRQQVLVASSIWTIDNAAKNTGSQHRTVPTFLAQGFGHVLSGYDHLAFLLALLLLVRRPLDLAWMITGFTLGHSLTLSLSVLGFVQANVPGVEAAIGLTIALVAVERFTQTRASALPLALICAAALLLMLPLSLHPRSVLAPITVAGLALFTFCYLLLAGRLGRRGAFRLLIAGLFGLIHGFGFAGGLIVGGGGQGSLLLPLLGFNLGVELGQLVLVAAVLTTVAAARRLSIAGPALPPAALQVTSMILCGAGVFWFVERALL